VRTTEAAVLSVITLSAVMNAVVTEDTISNLMDTHAKVFCLTFYVLCL